MAYKTRTVKSAPGLSQEKALITLQNHPEFKRGTRIASIYNQGGCWVAKLIEPKTANEDVKPCEHCEDKGCQHCKKTAAEAFEEIEEDVKESPAELHDKEHEEHEKSESPLEEHEEHEDSEAKKIKELEKKIDLLLDALGIDEKGKSPDTEPKGPDADLPAAPPKGGPAGGPKKSEPLPPGSGAKLKPGEVPNKPGMTPVGAPSFASVKQATDGAMGMPASPSASGPVGVGTQSCPTCGGTAGNCTCSNPAGTPAAPAAPSSPSASGPVTAFTASKLDGGRTLTIRQAKAQLENEFNGFRVARLKREGDALHARMVKRADFLA